MFNALSEWASYKLENLNDDSKRAEICGVSSESVRKNVPAIILAEDIDEAKRHANLRLNQPWPEVFFINNGSRIQIRAICLLAEQPLEQFGAFAMSEATEIAKLK